LNNDEISLKFNTSAYKIKIEPPSICCDKLVIYGSGFVRKKVPCHEEVSGSVDFI
jgi:hypothetical protein